MHQEREPRARALPPGHHPSLIIGLHWLICVGIVIAVAIILARDQTGARELRLWLLNQHRGLGFGVLGLVAVLLSARIWHRRRLIRHAMTWPMHLAAKGTHLVVYLLLFATPLLGWALTSARGQRHSFFGLVPAPAVFAPDPELADVLADWHSISAWTLVGMIVLHASAALWHQIACRDRVLHAMLPIIRPRAAVPVRLLRELKTPAQELKALAHDESAASCAAPRQTERSRRAAAKPRFLAPIIDRRSKIEDRRSALSDRIGRGPPAALIIIPASFEPP